MDKNKILEDLAKEVILPIIKILDKKLNLSPKESLKLIKKLHITQVAVIPFTKNINEQEIFKRFLYLEEIYKIGLKREEAKKILEDFYNSLENFLKKYNIKPNRTFEILFEALIKYHIDEDLIEEYKQKKEEFFDISSQRDYRIDTMHYKDEQKISAKEFMEEEYIGDEVIDELKDIFEEYEIISEEDLNEEYLKTYKEIIIKFITIFEYSIEFKDLAYGLEKLLNVLDDDLLQNPNKEFIKILLESVMEDLKKFYESVFLNQDAVDIHYLDASLLANIAQIEIIINQTKGE